LGIGDWAQSPNPKTPNPKPQNPNPKFFNFIIIGKKKKTSNFNYK
jgi:hypothetical protein